MFDLLTLSFIVNLWIKKTMCHKVCRMFKVQPIHPLLRTFGLNWGIWVCVCQVQPFAHHCFMFCSRSSALLMADGGRFPPDIFYRQCYMMWLHSHRNLGQRSCSSTKPRRAMTIMAVRLPYFPAPIAEITCPLQQWTAMRWGTFNLRSLAVKPHQGVQICSV